MIKNFTQRTLSKWNSKNAKFLL